MSVLATTRINTQAIGAVALDAIVEFYAPEQRILAVEFRSADGRRWNAIGGGATVAEAIIYARESCPDDEPWDAVSWNDLYGE
jgi:hypothetical protein